MLAKTHLAFGLLAALVIYIFLPVQKPLLFFVLVLAGSYLPDIDQSESKVNKKLKVTKIIPLFFGHRGFFHTILAAAALSGLLWYFIGSVYGIGVFVGYLSHLASDGLTVSGVKMLYPLKFHIRGPIKTGTTAEYAIFLVVMAINAWLFARAF